MSLKWLMICALAFSAIACGVKGDPQPPERPPQIGRGSPNYQRATEGLKLDFEEHDHEQDQNKDQDQDQEDPNESEEAP